MTPYEAETSQQKHSALDIDEILSIWLTLSFAYSILSYGVQQIIFNCVMDIKSLKQDSRMVYMYLSAKQNEKYLARALS